MNRIEYNALRKSRFNCRREILMWGPYMSNSVRISLERRISEITRAITPTERNNADAMAAHRIEVRRQAVEHRIFMRKVAEQRKQELAKLPKFDLSLPAAERMNLAFARIFVGFAGTTAEDGIAQAASVTERACR